MIARQIFLSIIFVIFSSFFHDAVGGELIIHDKGFVIVNSGSTLFLNCNHLKIRNGGTFKVQGGTVKKRGPLTLENGGRYIILGGKVENCCESFYFIPSPDGSGGVIICL